MNQMLLRSFDTELELRDEGREVYGRIVPFGVTAHVIEPDGNGGVDEYDEEFLPGCTERMRQVGPRFIRFTLDHDPGFDAWIGQCRQLDEQDDGAYATFGLHRTRDLDKVRSILAESHTGLSIEFRERGRPSTGPHRCRRSIHIAAVTATPIPVYRTAGILAMRSDADPLTAAGTPRLDAVRALLASTT